MEAEILDEEHVQAVWVAAIELGLAERRRELLDGIAPAVVAGLTGSTSPMAQMLLDLRALSMKLTDGSVPVVMWLRNAWLLAGDRVSAQVFAETLKHLGQAVPRRPKGKVEERAGEAKGAPVKKKRRAAAATHGVSVRAGSRSVVVVGGDLKGVANTGDIGRRERRGKR